MIGSGSLRDELRRATREVHDVLDRSLSPLATGPDYPRFLAIQHSARVAIEAWIEGVGYSCSPPRQSHLLAADLAELGEPLPGPAPAFAATDARLAEGVVWVLAGSSLGNKVMLKRRRAFDGGKATRFLADDAMAAYWASIRPRLERHASQSDVAAAVGGARAAFAHFLSVGSEAEQRLAA